MQLDLPVGPRDGRLRRAQPQHLAAVELQEVDRLGRVDSASNQLLPTSNTISALNSCLRGRMSRAASKR